jgi:hypothetical protein
MGTTTTKPPTHVRYEEDFVAWAAETAQLLLERRFDEIDIDSLAEEVQAMAKRDRRELRSRVAVILLHLLKWKYQPEKRSGSWDSTMETQRRELRYLLQDSPSLKREVAEAVKEAYLDAVRRAAKETGLRVTSFPSDCPFSPEQILDPTYLPE